MAGSTAGGPESTRLVVVAGSGRSGTSTIAGVLKYLGLHVPLPEVEANRTNPRGFFEPRWVVDFQSRLLADAGVRISDARPQAFAAAARNGSRPEVQSELRAWLGPVLQAAPEIIVKDPRSTWFLPMWREAAGAFGVTPSYLTMLRHPAEVVGSKSKYYAGTQKGGVSARTAQASRAAGWLNVTLFGEEATRDARRTFVRYDDLLADWRTAVTKAAADLDLSIASGFPPEGAAEVDSFIDPSLHRVQSTWDDIDIPTSLVDMCEHVWDLVRVLPDATGPDEGRQAELDKARAAYQELYADAEAIAYSTTDAPRPRHGRQPAKAGPQQPAPRSLAVRAASKARRVLSRAKR